MFRRWGRVVGSIFCSCVKMIPRGFRILFSGGRWWLLAGGCGSCVSSGHQYCLMSIRQAHPLRGRGNTSCILFSVFSCFGYGGERGVLVAFAFWPVGVVSFDEVVVEAHPFVEVVGFYEVLAVGVYVEDVGVVFADIAEDAPVLFGEVRPVPLEVAACEAGHVAVAWECVADGTYHDVAEVFVQHGGGEGFQLCYAGGELLFGHGGIDY